jgi:hypothetical protein
MAWDVPEEFVEAKLFGSRIRARFPYALIAVVGSPRCASRAIVRKRCCYENVTPSSLKCDWFLIICKLVISRKQLPRFARERHARAILEDHPKASRSVCDRALRMRSPRCVWVINVERDCAGDTHAL